MMMGYLFCVSAAFALAKFVRDNERRAVDTPLWRLVVWGGFFLAMSLTGWGLVQMEINPAYSAFLGVGWLFLISTSSRSPRRCATPTKASSPAAQAQRSLCAACERE